MQGSRHLLTWARLRFFESAFAMSVSSFMLFTPGRTARSRLQLRWVTDHWGRDMEGR